MDGARERAAFAALALAAPTPRAALGRDAPPRPCTAARDARRARAALLRRAGASPVAALAQRRRIRARASLLQASVFTRRAVKIGTRSTAAPLGREIAEHACAAADLPAGTRLAARPWEGEAFGRLVGALEEAPRTPPSPAQSG